jgi:hypothetical protein
VLRDDTREADVIVQLSTATWQAYNRWGGASLYESPNRALPDGRAYQVSYDRPYEAALDDGAGLFVSKEMPLVTWLEARGYDVAYVTSSDTDRAAPRGRVFIGVGHDEYASLDAMNHLTAARDAGANLIFLSGDSWYWQVRFENGRRVQTCYKESFAKDPDYGVDDARVTTRFRDPPVNHAEDALLGVMSMGEASSAPLDWIVKNGGHWVYEGTGLRDGDTIAGLVGYEWDTFTGDGNAPKGTILLSESPIPDKATQNAAFYQSAGGWVFAAGTIDFVRRLDDARVAQMLTNLLAHSGAKPAP